MNAELLTVALLAGLANWAFRVLPTRLRTDRLPGGGWSERFLAATGPAAIATLFTAAILPSLTLDLAQNGPVVVGVLTVVAAYALRPSIVLATLAGAVAHGATVGLLG